MKIYENESKQKQDALSACLEQANASIEEVLYEEMEIAKSLFKGTKYKVIVVTKEEIKNHIIQYLHSLGNVMNLHMIPTVKEENGSFHVYLESNNNAILIGKEGRVLRALQILLKQNLINETGISIKVSLDISGYREKKLKQLEIEIRKLANDVAHTKVDVKLDPMNSYERRFVHNIISEYSMLNTESIGEEPTRSIIISYKQD